MDAGPLPPAPIVQPVFHGPRQLPTIGGKPISLMRVEARRLYQLPGALVLPQLVVLDPETHQVVPYPLLAGEMSPHNGLRVYPDGTMTMARRLRRQDIMTIDEPAFVADASHHIYGHILLEVLPRLMLLDRCPAETVVLTSLPMRPPYTKLFEAMGVDLDRVRSLEAPARCRTTYLADSLIDLRNFVAPAAWSAFSMLAKLAAQSTLPPIDRIYVSRSRVGRRPLRNEAEVEALFRRYGFSIIHPEAMQIEDQIRLFSGARMIAGAGGSAMHNMIFAPPSTPVLILAARGLVLPIDAMLTRSEGALGYVLGSTDDAERPYVSSWSIDIDLVEKGIIGHFGL